ncbi:hypothetical protein FRZ67_03405 [Panacibacter ginsenosidivorans]|uniref:Uncharacterized protein n=1 Tax=Panacibacter ginsenosidivorans TaxID=1813871 RepID=A0A5B8V6A5_9BACT|nr:hypothetical protein [Panacibacter ginsenosidivorans]QEC66393.1 hypothetical protein FRZ67_03405 [Panacibacter ginsenosidivorans]
MERVDTLIKRLLELHESHSGNSAMLVTAQMLVHELQENNREASAGNKVSVIHPGIKDADVQSLIIAQAIADKVPEKEEARPVISVYQPASEPVKEKAAEIREEKQKVVKTYAPLPKIEEIPTFAYQQKDVFELNDSISSSGEQTLNDRLKTEKKELAAILKESPVKDLKKAIGINDRFVFIEELFRGDENMYERSIKTINSFTIFPEAEYWIQRELKTKIGWDEESLTVKHFDQLVRRRFS